MGVVAALRSALIEVAQKWWCVDRAARDAIVLVCVAASDVDPVAYARDHVVAVSDRRW